MFHFANTTQLSVCERSLFIFVCFICRSSFIQISKENIRARKVYQDFIRVIQQKLKASVLRFDVFCPMPDSALSSGSLLPGSLQKQNSLQHPVPEACNAPP